MANRDKLNVLAFNYAEIETFRRENNLKTSEIRVMRDVTSIYGMWQGEVLVLSGAYRLPDYQRLLVEIEMRGMKLRHLAEGEKL